MALVLAAALAVAGCGSDDSDDGGGGGGGGDQSAAVAEATEMVKEAMKPPQWETPGPAFDAKKAAGETVAIIAVTTEVPAVNELDEEMEKALNEVGVKTTVGDGKASPTEFARLMQQAVQADVAAIILNAVDPKAVAQPLKQAKAAGVPVITMFEADPSQPLPEGVVGRADFSYKEAGELLAAWASSDAEGDANGVAIQSSDAPSQAAMLGGFEDAWDRFCAECPLDVKDVSVAEWQSQLGPTVRSALLADPDVNYLLPMYDGMMLNIVPAVQQAGKIEQVKMGSLNATPAVMEFLVNGDIEMDIGESNPWLAWAAADQALRAVVGEKPVKDENVPLRVFTAENFPSEVGSEDDPTTWYGDVDFEEEYRKLWGLK
ncbi:MAG TPA: sugar ABC transporter substrate-binding protein [Solirubrobacterales bacterium]|nr:sugar ABC transporter substrate-binding protein [Solirubrobacterales bacterium]